MKMWQKKIRRFLVLEDGPTAVEYAVMLAMIFMVCMVAISLVGTQTNQLFERSVESIEAAQLSGGS